jgi:hypothetical protein
MDQGDISDHLSAPSPGRGLSKRVVFWSEIVLLLGATSFSAALLINDHSMVRSRREVRRRYEGDSQFRCILRDDPSFQTRDRTADVSWFRRLLGDEAVSLIFLPRQVHDDELARVRSLFPEARVERFPIVKPQSASVRPVENSSLAEQPKGFGGE